jgi:hypothetical protein
MKADDNIIDRKKLLTRLGILSIFAFAGFRLKGKKTETAPKTVKMLTEDGKLVEVDAGLLATNRKRISNSELQNWVKPEK